MNDINAEAARSGSPSAAGADAGRRLVTVEQNAIAGRDPYRLPGSHALPATQQEDFWQVVLDFW